ncbi:MAG TPA: NADH-quinone oxidoreductase subunit J [Acidimicrobiales bacterium]|jgi:NADH-quinone oxidoreductase subunit J
MVELAVFVVAAAAALVGAVGVISTRNPVHSALLLVLTLFGVAVLFVAQDAHFLAAVQVIVYAGAIVVLFLFVIMLLGVDQAENLRTEPLAGQRPAAAVVGLAVLGVVLGLALVGAEVTGERSAAGAISAEAPNVQQLGESIFTDYLFAFEITSVLLVIAVVAAVVLARRGPVDGVLDEAEEDAAAARVDELTERREGR